MSRLSRAKSTPSMRDWPGFSSSQCALMASFVRTGKVLLKVLDGLDILRAEGECFEEGSVVGNLVWYENAIRRLNCFSCSRLSLVAYGSPLVVRTVGISSGTICPPGYGPG